HRHSRRGRYAELRLQCLHELREFEYADPLDVVDNLLLCNVPHGVLLVGLRLPASGSGTFPEALRLKAGRHSCYCSCLFFSACTNTLIRSLGTALKPLTICTIGACSTNNNFAYSSGLPGKAARSITSAGLIAR